MAKCHTVGHGPVDVELRVSLDGLHGVAIVRNGGDKSFVNDLLESWYCKS